MSDLRIDRFNNAEQVLATTRVRIPNGTLRFVLARTGRRHAAGRVGPSPVDDQVFKVGVLNGTGYFAEPVFAVGFAADRVGNRRTPESRLRLSAVGDGVVYFAD